MEEKLKRPERKTADVKVTDADMIYFSLGLKDSREFRLPSERDDYRSDERAVRLIQDLHAGRDLSHRDFSGLNLKGADISGGSFIGCNFKGAIFYHTKAQTADFSECCFDEAYIEESDFTGCDLTGASFKRAFFKKNNTQKAFFDEETEKYLTELEKIIRLIEKGEIDIRSLSKEDLLCLDVRRLDFSKIDLTDIDLSVFALDGINLCGTYVDPKQLMSLQGWNSYCLDVRKAKEKTRERLCRKIMLEKNEALQNFHREQLKNRKKKSIHTKNPVRPRLKEPEQEENRIWGIEKFRLEQARKEEQKQKEAQALVQQEKNKVVSENADRDKAYAVSKDEIPLSSKEKDHIGGLTSEESSLAADKQIRRESLNHPIPNCLSRQSAPSDSDNKLNQTNQIQADNRPLQTNQIQADNRPQQTGQPISFADKQNLRPQMIVSHDAEKKAELKAEVSLSSQRNTYYAEQELQKRKKMSETGIVREPVVEKEVSPKPKKPTDETDTVYDLTNAGYSIEEISRIVREKGPMRVIGKAQNMRPTKGKTKG